MINVSLIQNCLRIETKRTQKPRARRLSEILPEFVVWEAQVQLLSGGEGLAVVEDAQVQQLLQKRKRQGEQKRQVSPKRFKTNARRSV